MFLGKHFFKTHKATIIYIVILTILVVCSFWRLVFFYFFQDDFSLIWGSLYNFNSIVLYFKHPGTPFEFLLLSPIFGTNSYVWQLLGTFLKIATAYYVSVFMFLLTKSKKISILSGLFFAASYTGMATISSPANHVTALAALCILFTFIFLLKILRGQEKAYGKFVIVLFVGIVLDPARVLPILLFFPFIILVFPKSKNKKAVISFLKKLYLICAVIFLPLASIYATRFASDGPLHDGIILLLQNPQQGILKINRIGNFFATITNLFTELVIGLHLTVPLLETADYMRPFGVAGVALFLFGLVSFYQFFKKKLLLYFFLSFFILWTFIFYFPNFLAEPRAPMAALNHYLYISSIGSVCLIAYLISLLSKKWFVICSIFFIALNIYKANSLLSQQFVYRSTPLVEKMWNQVVHTVPKNYGHTIILFQGKEPWLSASLMSWGGEKFLMITNDSKITDEPFLSENEYEVISQVCSSTTLIQSRVTTVYPPTPLSHVFAWNVGSGGNLQNNTQQVRKWLIAEAKKRKCHITE